MATIAQIRADLVGSSASFRAEMIAGQRQANDSLVSIRREVASTSESLRALNTAAAGLVGFEAIKGGVQSLIDAQKAAQQIHFSLVSATGSTTAADAAYKAVSATADQLGLDLKTSALGFSSMSAAAAANGVSMRDQQALFDGLARSSTVLHLSSEQTGRAINALSQIFGKGKIQAEELRQQLGDAIPGVVPRFQTAVMAMTKGTDLAGKSFDQLLQSGDVTVQRFLPALIQALNETGKGADQAATGLNASINRLSTEWFKLKTDLSGGLFSDAAIGSIDLVAHNLENLANLAGVTGGLIVARLAGGGLSQAASSATDYVSQQRAAREAAVAAAELAQQNTATAAAEIRQNEAALAGVTTARQQATAQREAAQALYQKALAENEAAQATLAHQRTTLTLSANLRAQRDATAQAAAAAINLARAEAQYNAASAGSTALTEQKIALEGQLFRARGAATIAAEAEAAAERQLAATSAAGILSRGAASLGTFALGLVGGPWGAAVAAIGAVGYAIYDTQKRSEEYRKETDELAKSIQQVRAEAEQTAKAFGTLDGSMTIKQGIEQYREESAAIADQRKALADLQGQADAIRARIAGRSNGTAGGAFANLFDERELSQVNDRIAKLQDQLGPAVGAVDALGNKMSGILAPSIDTVKRALDGLANGRPLLDVVFDLSSGFDKGVAAADAALASIRSIQQKFQSDAKTLTDKAATDGLNNVQKIQYQYRQALADLEKLGGSDRTARLAELNSSYVPAVAAAQQVDAADAAKKAATEAANQARQWKQQADSLNQSLLQTRNELTAQLDSTQRLTPAEKQLQDILGGTNDAYNHAAASLKTRMLAQAQANAELAKSVELQQQEAAAAARSAALHDQLASRVQRQAEAADLQVTGVGHGREVTQQLQDELRIRQDYDRQKQQYDKEAGRLAPGTPGSIGSDKYNDDIAGIVASQQQELAIYRAGVQRRLGAEDDWKNGAQAALEDYRSSAADVAGATYSLFTDAFDGMGDALANFATTGKLDFKSLATSILSDLAQMETRIAASQILQSIIGAFSGGGTGVSYDLGGSSSSYSSLAGVSDGSYGGGFNLAGGRANGGPVAPGNMYEVAEGGKPELLTSGGRTYLMTGSNGGHVTPASDGGRAASASVDAGTVVNVAVTVNADGSSDSGSSNDATGFGKRIGQAIADGARQVIAQEKRTGGMLWEGRKRS